MANVVYEHIFKNYGSVEVLKDISVQVNDGEFTALLGPSGCGKSTLLRLTAGLEAVSSGDIFIDGKKMNNVHPRNRNIAMVFQNYALYPQMNIYNNIAFSLQVKKLPKAEIDKQVKWAANTLGIEPLLERYPQELSGGQRQRVAMGRAIVRDPKVFLFDEPLSNLDAKLRERMRVEVRTIHNRLKATTIYVTHDQVEAMTMADKIMIMEAGIIQQIGSPGEVFDYPTNLFVADFIGTPSINLLPGKMAVSEGKYFLDGGTFTLPLPANTQAKPGQALIYGIRPQHIKLVTDPAETESDTVDATLLLCETTGTESQLSFDFWGRTLTVVNQGRFNIPIDTKCRLSVDIQRVHLFDEKSKKRLDLSADQTK